MLKRDLLRAVSAAATELHARNKKYSYEDIETICRAYSQVVLDTLTADREENVPMFGMGKFEVRHLEARDGQVDGKAWHKEATDRVVLKISPIVKTLGGE